MSQAGGFTRYVIHAGKNGSCKRCILAIRKWSASSGSMSNAARIASAFGTKQEGKEYDMDNVVFVDRLPRCDFCGDEAHYEGQTIFGLWGYMCLFDFADFGVGLGLGKGQELRLRDAQKQENTT